MNDIARNERFWPTPQDDDQREQAQRDRDRILYSSALRRLGGVTQVVSAAEGHVFHNRLTHSLEVAQIARRISENILATQKDLVKDMGGLDPEVCEAAALAHDLGHPPFGHIAEQELDQLARKKHLEEGFEGNAQSFRIITKLSAHSRKDENEEGYPGLNLTRATLNAVLKYPWLRDTEDPRSSNHKFKKFGAYRSEKDIFEWAREGTQQDHKSIEASIMDHADQIAYSIHDLDDFYRAGLIPLGLLAAGKDEFNTFIEAWKEKPRGISPSQINDNRDQFQRLIELIPQEQYIGTREQAAYVRRFTSQKIEQFVKATVLHPPNEQGEILSIPDPSPNYDMRFLQSLVWYYVIDNPRLATQQYGQRQIIKYLFKVYLKAVKTKNHNIIPPRFVNELEKLKDLKDGKKKSAHPEEVRMVVDIIASLSDQQATFMYRRLRGFDPGYLNDTAHG